MQIDVTELELILLPGKCPPKKYMHHYLKAYHCWREVWDKKNGGLTSDEFTCQDEVIALFHKGECSAVCFLKWVEADERQMVCGQITVHAKYSENDKQIPWKDLLVALVRERFKHSDRDSMSGLSHLPVQGVDGLVKSIFPKTVGLAKPIKVAA
ncbi:MAG TPA: hypothetical protein VNJ08_04470 [Bacteriovoracaceae bacterium]|nr:hypothetical protein [Bacteriovoracaceae bacterium]